MKKIHINKSVFFKYSLSYLAVLIIPITIISLVLSSTVFNILEKEIFENNKKTVLMSTNNLVKELESGQTIVNSLGASENINYFNYSENVSKAINLISTLKRYLVSNSFFDSVFVYFTNDQWLYSNSSSYTIDNFFKTYGSSEEIDGKLHSILDGIIDYEFVFDETENTIYYAVPLMSHSKNIGSVIFAIDSKKLNNLLGITADDTTEILIFDSENNLLNSPNSNILFESMDKDILYSLVESTENGKYASEKIGPNIIYTSKVAPFDLIYISITSVTDAFKQLTNVQALLFTSIIIAIIIGITAIYMLIKINYKPIESLKNLSKSLGEVAEDGSVNEFDYIENTITTLNKKNSKLQIELLESLPIKQNFLLNLLINGNISDESVFLAECESINLNLTSAYHIVVTVKSKKLPKFLSTIISDYSLTNINFDYEFLVNQLSPDISIFLVGISDKNMNISEKYDLNEDMVLSFGSIQDTLINIAKSYIDSRTHLEFSKSETSDSYISQCIKKYNENIEYASHILSLSKFDELEIIVSNTISDLDNETIPFALVRNVYFELIIMLNSFIDKNKHLSRYNIIDISSLYEIENIDTIRELFLESFNELISSTKERDIIQTPKLTIEAIKNIINMNYCDYSFSLQLLADEFGVSLSYLSQYFKDKTDSTILDYITSLKMNKAKELLETTSLTLKDVAEQVGYINVSSFIRRFKQVTGTTPGEYKKQNLISMQTN